MSEHSDKTAFVSVPADETASPTEGPKLGVPERRKQERYPFNADAEIVELRSRTRLSARCSDLGPGGCYVDTMTPLTVGAEIRIRLKRDGRELEAAATVTYSCATLGMGMKFTDMKPEHREVLRSWIAELSGAPGVSEAPPAAVESEPGPPASNTNFLIVLNQLVALLVRKKILSESEGAGLLRKMFE
jgi:hypothetical protein